MIKKEPPVSKGEKPTVVGAQELTRQRDNKIFHRIRPEECPISKKYCRKSFIETNPKSEEKVEEQCAFLKYIGLGNEDGFCIIHCSAIANSIKFIMDDSNGEPTS